jgi:hypothetical protein
MDKELEPYVGQKYTPEYEAHVSRFTGARNTSAFYKHCREFEGKSLVDEYRQYLERRHQYINDHGLCVKCLKPGRVPGHSVCQPCLKQARAQFAETKKEKAARKLGEAHEPPK